MSTPPPPPKPLVLRLLKWLCWGGLWAMALVGLAATAFLFSLLVEHARHCDDPGEIWAAECLTNADASAFLFAYGVPWLLPLLLALLIRFVYRRTRP